MAVARSSDLATAIDYNHKNFVKIARVVSEISSRIDRHTDILITILAHGGEVMTRA